MNTNYLSEVINNRKFNSHFNKQQPHLIYRQKTKKYIVIHSFMNILYGQTIYTIMVLQGSVIHQYVEYLKRNCKIILKQKQSRS